jgi:DNA/RNA-binding domain of Phe-tRNA-synthetase-like protein
MTVGLRREGWIDPALAEELPHTRLVEMTVEAVPGRSTRAGRVRLSRLADRFTGAQVVALRQEPIPHAYRVFHRHVGLDPDVHRTPVEEAAMQRLLRGGFRARGRIHDALLIAVVETGVPVWALDDAALDGSLGLRFAGVRERLGTHDLPEGRMVVCDAASPVAVLFGATDPAREVSRSTRRVRLYAVAVAGVPAVHVEEALDVCLDALHW